MCGVAHHTVTNRSLRFDQGDLASSKNMDRDLAFDRAFFALAFLRQTLQEGQQALRRREQLLEEGEVLPPITQDVFAQANSWAQEFAIRREAAKTMTHQGVRKSRTWHPR